MIKYFFAIISTGILFSCGSKSSSSNGELIGVVESKTAVGDPSAEEYDETWLPLNSRNELLEDFLDKVKNNEFEVFEFMPGELSPMASEDLQYIFHHVDTEYVEQEDGTNLGVPIEEDFDASGIVYLKFKEALYYDKSKGSFEKKVKYVCPMEKVYNEDGSTRGFRGLFWVKLK